MVGLFTTITTPTEAQISIKTENYALKAASKAAGEDVTAAQLAKSDGTLPRNVHAAYENAMWDYKTRGADGNAYEKMRIKAAESNFRKEDYLGQGQHTSGHAVLAKKINEYQNKISYFKREILTLIL